MSIGVSGEARRFVALVLVVLLSEAARGDGSDVKEPVRGLEIALSIASGGREANTPLRHCRITGDGGQSVCYVGCSLAAT